MTLADTLREYEGSWRERPLLRRIYGEWFDLIASKLANVPGETVELGSGIGRLRDHVSGLVTTDVEPTPWADRVVDAESLPYGDGVLANLVLVDVYHHLPRPAAFLDEARRTLAPGGRVVMLEPYCSPLATLAYRVFHEERLDLDADGFAGWTSDGPMDANIAQPTLAFYRQAEVLKSRWPELRLVERRRLTLFLYSLSGGFSKRQLVPAWSYQPLATVERLLSPLLPLAAFRCLVVLERHPSTR